MSDKQIPDYYPGTPYQPLFSFLHDQFGILPLESDMTDIIQIVHKMEATEPSPNEESLQSIKDEAFKAGYQSATRDLKAVAKPYTKTFETEWKAVDHSYQIGDTGDYDGYTEITNGCISIGLKDNYDDQQVRIIVEALNRWKIKMFELRADGLAIDLYCAEHEKKMLEARIKELEIAGVRWVKASDDRPVGWQLVRFGELSNRFPAKFSPNVIADVSGKTYQAWQLEYLDESSPSPVQPNPIDTDELWDEHSEMIGDDIDSLSMLAGKTVMGRRAFNKAIEQLSVQPKKEAIDFKNWTMTDDCRYYWIREQEWRNMDNPKEPISTTELYEVYQQSK